MFCQYCGGRLPAHDRLKHLECPHCQTMIYRNPIPVVAILLPVQTKVGIGLLVVKRGIEDQDYAKWAHVSGYIECREGTNTAGWREIMEELGLKIDPNLLTTFQLAQPNERGDQLVNFLVLEQPLQPVDLLGLKPDPAEVLEVKIIYQADLAHLSLAWPGHQRAA